LVGAFTTAVLTAFAVLYIAFADPVATLEVPDTTFEAPFATAL
jgi:hypothetical protein